MHAFHHTALVADALCLGAHWVYDQEEIAEAFPQGIREFADPLSKYHPTKTAGHQTHYGDQAIMLANSLRKRGGFDPDGWREDWLEGMRNYKGYVDGASRETLKSEGSVPSGSDDLGGASRIGPILDLGLGLDETIAAARAQTGLTHGAPAVADTAEFFVRAARAVGEGELFEGALDRAAKEGTYGKLDVGKCLKRAIETRDEEFPRVAREIGQACGVGEAFPLALYFALRPETDFAKTIGDNALAGGDSAARGMLLALLFAAANPETAVPWLGELKAV